MDAHSSRVVRAVHGMILLCFPINGNTMHQKTLLVPAAQISFVFLFVHLLLAFSTLLLCRSVSDKWYQSRVFEGPRRRHDASAETPRPFTGQEG